MRKIVSLIALAAIIAGLIAFSPRGGADVTSAATPEPTAAATVQAVDEPGYTGTLDKELYVYNWAGYIDEDLLKEYEQKYGVKITYDNFASNEELFAKIQNGALYDIIFPTDYLIQRLIQLNLIVKLDRANIPNIANVAPNMLDTWYDPGAQYCAPYNFTVTGIAYQKTLDKKPTGWAAIFDPEQAKYYTDNGGINVLDDQRELIGAALQYLGYSINDTNADHLAQARDTIIKVKPYIKYFNSSDYQDTLLVPKQVALSQSWGGDAGKAALATDGAWEFVQPKEGGARTQDGMCIPASSKRKATAEHFINYLLRAESAARTTNKTGYLSTNRASWSLINPVFLAVVPLNTLDKIEWFQQLDETASKLYDDIWTEIKSAP